jgi:transposase-like protein
VWTHQLKARARKRLKKGETYVAIARDFKVTPQTLWAILNRKRS